VRRSPPGPAPALSGYLGAGHLDTTTEPDLLAWAIILIGTWMFVRADRNR